MKSKLIGYIIWSMAALVLVACATVRKHYHDTTLHYNKYFLANEKLNEIEADLWKQHKDDYNSDGTTVYRRTTMSYTSYPSQHILGLPLTTSVYAGPGTTLLTKSENVYDETGTYQDSNSQTVNYFVNAGATVQHDDTNYGSGFTNRGNVTTVKQYQSDGTTNRIVGRTSYDTNGNVRSLADAAGNRKTLDLTDNFTNKPAGLGALQAYPYLTADPAGMKAGAQYEYYTGHVVKTFAQRPNQSTEEQVTTTTYDFADRPLRTTSPTGSYVELGYWDNLLRQTTYTKRDVISGVDQLVYSWQDFNGAGLVLRYGGHIGIDVLQERLPAQAPYLRVLIFVLLLGFFAFMAWIGTRYAMLTWSQTTPVLQIPVGIVYAAMPAGFVLLIVHLLLMAAPYIRRRQFLVDTDFDPEAAQL